MPQADPRHEPEPEPADRDPVRWPELSRGHQPFVALDETGGLWHEKRRPGLPARRSGLGVVLFLVAVVAIVIISITRAMAAPTVAERGPAVVDPPEVTAVAPAELVRVPMSLVEQPRRTAVRSLAVAGLQVTEVRDPEATPEHTVDMVTMVHPRPGTLVPRDSVVTLTYVPAGPPATAVPTPPPALAPERTEPAVDLIDGDPAGSGCTPGAATLPDGQWVGHASAGPDGTLDLDLVCFDSTTGTTVNDRTQLRSLLLADALEATCGEMRCGVADVIPGALVVVQVEDGAVVALHEPRDN